MLLGLTYGDFKKDTGWGGVTGQFVAGFIPIYGQLADARDTIAAITEVWEDPFSSEAWVGLAMSGIAWLPGFGDAAKGGYRVTRNAVEEVSETISKNADSIGRVMPGPVYKTTKEATEAAIENGWRRTNMRSSNGQVIFTDGKNFFSRDADGHIGGAWKLMDPHNPTRRIGTLDANLNIIGD